MTAKVGVFGAWSIDNTGDAMIGLATRRALAERLPGAEIIAFAPELPGGVWAHDRGRARGIDTEITLVPVDDLAWARELDALVIGGGGIINFQAPFRGFLLGGAAWDGPPAAWNGVCGQNTAAHAATADERDALRRCCEQLAYVSVRNTTTLKLVRGCGFAGPVAVVPDAAIDLPRQRVAPDHFTVGVSIGSLALDARAARFHDALFTQLVQLATGPRRARLELIPFGGIYGDVRLHALAAARLPGARVVPPSSPDETWRAIGRTSVYIGARLHAIIAALVHGVPFVALDEYLSDATATSKVRDLLVDAELEAHYLCPLVSRDPGPKLAAQVARADDDPEPFAALVAGWRARLAAHWDAMIRALHLEPSC